MAALFLAAAVFLCVSAASALETEFDSADRNRLDSGELVTRPMSQRRGELRLVGGTSWQVVDASADVLSQAIVDVARYPRMLPQVSNARSVAQADGVTTVRIQHEVGPVDVSYHVALRRSGDGRGIFFQLDRDRPGSLRAAWGFVRVSDWDEGRSLITYGIMADVGSGVVAGLLMPAVREWMLKVPWTMKKFVEGSGRKLYSDS